MKKSLRKQTTKLSLVFVFLILKVSLALAIDIQMVGHRGAAGLMPENTLSGFKRAMELGVDAFELDVHLTSDNVVVVTHDYRLNPAITRDGQGNWVKDRPLIKDLTLAEVQSYDVGKLDRSTSYAEKYRKRKSVDGEHIPTLRDVIRLVKSTDETTHIFIEIKTTPLKPEDSTPPEALSNAIAKILEEEGFSDRVRIISFDWRGLRYIKKIMPKVHTAHVTRARKYHDTIQKKKPGPSPWMAGFDIDDFKSIPQAIKAAGGECWASSYKHASGHGRGMKTKQVEEAHGLGVDVFVWTVNSKWDMKRMIKIGVDGIITDRPDILRSIVKK
ncbi:MAG: glycerophosphodiester phosphodiesterase [Candidatus Aenigmarchaeota archaeon]|nr:glycerophosphodiester phosphodiesterase [Candidatus Aenigmarchaeota archaeon]